jgi:hypothetical protein
MKQQRPKAWGTIGAALAVTAASSIARADDAAGAQALFDQAKRAMASHDYGEACAKFEESLRLQAALGTLLNLADCYEREGKLAMAWSTFLELASKATEAGQAERAKIGKKRAAALAPRLSNLVVTVADTTPGLEVKRDGTVAGRAEWGTPMPVDAGRHTVEATAPGKQPWATTVNVDEAKTATVAVPELVVIVPESPPPAPALSNEAAPQSGAGSPPAPTVADTTESNHGLGAQRTLALVSGAVGLVGVGVGTYFGLQSASKHSDATAKCPQSQCPRTPDGEQGLGLWNDASTAGNRSTVAFVVGGVGLAGAAVLWFTAPNSSARVGVGVGSVQLRGAW